MEVNEGCKLVPATITIHEGSEIWWTNNDLVTHMVTAPGIFDSGDMPSGGIWTYNFDEPGTYDYTCDYHDYMNGKIVVKNYIEFLSEFRSNTSRTIDITSPTYGATVSGKVKVEGVAKDLYGKIQSVDLRIDFGKWEKPEGIAEWSYELDTTLLSDGFHTIRVRSFDDTMQYSEYESITINVKNEKEQSSPISAPILIVSGIFILVWRMKKRHQDKNTDRIRIAQE